LGAPAGIIGSRIKILAAQVARVIKVRVKYASAPKQILDLTQELPPLLCSLHARAARSAPHVYDCRYLLLEPPPWGWCHHHFAVALPLWVLYRHSPQPPPQLVRVVAAATRVGPGAQGEHCHQQAW